MGKVGRVMGNVEYQHPKLGHRLLKGFIPFGVMGRLHNGQRGCDGGAGGSLWPLSEDRYRNLNQGTG